MLPTITPTRAGVHSPRADHVPSPILPPARRSTAERLHHEALTRRHQPAGSGISAGQPPRRVRRALPCWASREDFVALVEQLAQTNDCQTLCRRHEVAVATFVATMVTAAIQADSRTGMLWAGKHAIASKIQREDKVVQRSLAIARELGLALEVYRGRELGRDERLALAREHHQHPQRGIPSGWQLGPIPPARRARFRILTRADAGRFTWLLPPRERFVHLPPWGRLPLQTHLWDTVTTARAARYEMDAAPPRLKTPGVAPEVGRRRRGVALAAELIRADARLRLFASCTPGLLAPQLATYQDGGWHGADLAAVLVDLARGRGIDPAAIAHHPLAALRALLETVDPIADPVEAGFAGQLCHLCHGQRGRHRDLPLTRVVCDDCWTRGQQALAATPPVACGHPDCDGHGWVSTTDTAGNPAVQPCPRCAPAVRGHANTLSDPAAQDGGRPDQEPAF